MSYVPYAVVRAVGSFIRNGCQDPINWIRSKGYDTDPSLGGYKEGLGKGITHVVVLEFLTTWAPTDFTNTT